jgi:hypothetical protein
MPGISDAAESIGFRTNGVKITFEQFVCYPVTLFSGILSITIIANGRTMVLSKKSMSCCVTRFVNSVAVIRVRLGLIDSRSVKTSRNGGSDRGIDGGKKTKEESNILSPTQCFFIWFPP